jgi:aspartate/methionine/tyrosine aminotransferase
MKINKSGVSFSSIVGIGLKIKEKEKETGNKYLPLNRGVNQVINIDLSKIINKIDFNSNELQHYAPNLGIEKLKKNIAKEYFSSYSDIHNFISIVGGGMPCLDITLQILNVKKIYFPYMYWGSYSKMADIRGKSYDFYKSLDDSKLLDLDENSCIFICSPSNPTGIHIDKNYLIDFIKKITDKGATIILDCPYYKLFFEDNFFEEALRNGSDNIIICESFSKCYGLSGVRLGFICSLNKEFNEELNIRMLYEFNGISTMPQLLISNLISSEEGKKAIKDFQLETTNHIKMNINFLRENNLLVDEIYEGDTPLGIFAIINKSEDLLFQYRIGAVGLDKFCYFNKDKWSSYSRICVSVPNEKFLNYLSQIC